MGGQDKGLITFGNRPIIEHLLKRISPQSGSIIINANRNIDTYSALGYPVIRDDMEDYQGPLAGFCAAMKYASTPLIAVLPCDGPFVPDDLMHRLLIAMNQQATDIAVAHDGERLQPVYALIKTSLLADLQAFLSTGDRKIDRWYAQNRTATADFSDIPEIFHNINTPEQYEDLQQKGLA